MIPKNKINDEFAGESKIYEKIKHDDDVLICDHCKYNKQEDWLENFITKTDYSKATVKFKSKTGADIIQKFKSLRVARGKFNDVIGVFEQWS